MHRTTQSQNMSGQSVASQRSDHSDNVTRDVSENASRALPPVGAPIDLTEWASPREVLELRAAWDKLQLQHATEVKELRRKLETLESECASLRDEVRETERLRHQFGEAKAAFNRAQLERNQWMEERELLMLRLQRMANEIERLRAAAAASNVGPHIAPAASAGSSSGSVPRTGSHDLKTPSVSTGENLSNQSLAALASASTTSDLVALMEENNRSLVIASFMEQRQELFQLVVHFDHQRTVRAQLVAAAENEQLKQRLRITEDALDQTRRTLRFSQEEGRSLRAEVDELREQLTAMELKHVQAIADTERQWEQQWQDDLMEKESAWKSRFHQLEEAEAAAKLECSSLSVTLDAQRKQRDTLMVESRASNDALQNELRVLQGKYNILVAVSCEAEQKFMVECKAAAEELVMVSRARDDASKLAESLQLQNDSLQSSLHEARIAFEQQGMEMIKLRMMQAKSGESTDVLKALEGERDAFRVRAVKLEEEIGVQREFFEKQLRISQGAFSRLQQQKRQETEVLLSELVALRSSKAQASAVVKRQKLNSRSETGKENIEPVAPAAADPHLQQNSTTTAQQQQPSPVLLDPVQVLRATKQIADRLQSSIRR